MPIVIKGRLIEVGGIYPMLLVETGNRRLSEIHCGRAQAFEAASSLLYRNVRLTIEIEPEGETGT